MILRMAGQAQLPCRNVNQALAIPSTLSTTPVMYEASSEAKNTKALAISSGFPRRRRGMFAVNGSRTSLGTAFIMSVCVMPGATAFTRIPFGPSSRAKDTVSPFTANLDAGYAKPLGWPEMLTIDEVERITPLPLATMHSAAARVALKTPFTFKSMTLSKVSSV